MARITLDQLSFRYDGAPQNTLEGLDLEIADGEAHALLGASGSGKTTLLNLLSGLSSPTGGALCFDGLDVSAQRGRERGVAQVFQFPVLYEALDVRSNLAFPLRNRGVAEAEIKQRLGFIADEMELGHLLGRRVGGLSLFEKQLVAVGKALMRRDVSVVLLDEPLTAVEPKTKWRLRQTLRRVQADTGVTMVYVTHDQTEALTFADRVSVLADGRILQTATPEEIYAAPRYEYVGHFVGSPGMNFLSAAAVGKPSCDNIGFRPEWARLGETGELQAVVTRVRTLGTREGVPVGITQAVTNYGEVSVRGATQFSVGAQARLHMPRYLVFRDRRLVEQVGAQ